MVEKQFFRWETEDPFERKDQAGVDFEAQLVQGHNLQFE